MRNISSVTSRAPLRMTPKPTPGKNESIVCLANDVSFAFYETGLKGLPVATRARPPDQATMSPGEASVFDVGFERGRTTGVGTCLAISRMADSVKLPGTPLVPIRIVGRTYRMTVSKSYGSAAGKPNCAMSSGVSTKGCLSLSMRALPSNSKPAESSMTVAARRRHLRLPRASWLPEQGGRCQSRRRRSQKYEPLRREGAARHLQRCQNTCQGDTGSSLDVVIEAWDAITVAVQNSNCIVLLEVFPLQDRLWKTSRTPSTKASMNSS